MEPEPIAWRDEIDEERECPVYLALQYKDVLFMRAMAEKGLLPVAGGWREQPNYWIQALEVIGAQVANVERERMDAMRNKNMTLDA